MAAAEGVCKNREKVLAKNTIESGTGSRGSAIVIDLAGTKIHDGLEDTWRILQENRDFRAYVLESYFDVSKGNVVEWFKAGVIAVGAGSNLCPKAMLNEEYDKITAIAREFVDAVSLAKQAPGAS